MSIGDKITNLRNKRNLTQESLSKRVGISRARLSHYEKDRREPDFETLNKLADFFEVTTDYLLGRSSSPKKTEAQDDYDPLEDLRTFMLENNMQDMDLGFYDIEKWKKLTPEDVEEVKRHFRWVVQRAEEREKGK